MSRFEYKVIRIGEDDIGDDLTRQGMEGWQVIRVEKLYIATEPDDESPIKYSVWFMRELTPQPLIVHN